MHQNPKKEELRGLVLGFLQAGGDFYCGEIAEGLGVSSIETAEALAVLRRRSDVTVIGMDRGAYLYRASTCSR